MGRLCGSFQYWHVEKLRFVSKTSEHAKSNIPMWMRMRRRWKEKKWGKDDEEEICFAHVSECKLY